MVSIENTVNNLFSCNVLDLATTEIIALGKTFRFFTAKGGQHDVPNLFSGVHSRFVKTNLIKETALECRIHITCEVGRGNHYPREIFHSLKNNILTGILHLVCSCIGIA